MTFDVADALLAIAAVTAVLGVIGGAKLIPGAAQYAWRTIGSMVKRG